MSETVLQVHGTPPLKFLEKHNVKAKRMTRFSSKGLVNSFFTKSCITEKSIEGKIVKCFNFLQKNDLLPTDLKSYSSHQLARFKKQLFLLYIRDNKVLMEILL